MRIRTCDRTNTSAGCSEDVWQGSVKPTIYTSPATLKLLQRKKEAAAVKIRSAVPISSRSSDGSSVQGDPPAAEDATAPAPEEAPAQEEEEAPAPEEPIIGSSILRPPSPEHALLEPTFAAELVWGTGRGARTPSEASEAQNPPKRSAKKKAAVAAAPPSKGRRRSSKS